MKHVTEKKELEALRAAGPVCIDFYAPWCGPCKILGKKLPDLAEQFSHVTFVKVNINDASELAEEYNVTSIPMVVVSETPDKATIIKGLNLQAIVSALNGM